MTTSPVLYAPLYDLKDRLGITDETKDFTLERSLDAASRWIEQQTAHKFYVTTQTRLYTAERLGNWHPPSDISERPGGGYQYLPIDDLFVSDFASVTVKTDWDGDGIFEQTWTANTDFWLGPTNSYVNGKPYRFLYRNQPLGRYWFPYWPNGVSVTGPFGYCSDTPADIREVCLECAMELAQPVLGLSMPGVREYQIGQELRVVADSTRAFSTQLSLNALSALSQQTINNYRQAVV